MFGDDVAESVVLRASRRRRALGAAPGYRRRAPSRSSSRTGTPTTWRTCRRACTAASAASTRDRVDKALAYARPRSVQLTLQRSARRSSAGQHELPRADARRDDRVRRRASRPGSSSNHRRIISCTVKAGGANWSAPIEKCSLPRWRAAQRVPRRARERRLRAAVLPVLRARREAAAWLYRELRGSRRRPPARGRSSPSRGKRAASTAASACRASSPRRTGTLEQR